MSLMQLAKANRKIRLIEPALTFFNLKIITKIGEGQQAQIDYLNKQNKELEKQMLNQKKELKMEFLIYRFEEEMNSYQEFIVSKYERMVKIYSSYSRYTQRFCEKCT